MNEKGLNAFLEHYSIEIKHAELVDLRILATSLRNIGCGIEDFDKFYVGYKIPQIGKEFDLLRFGQKSIINIELKSSSTEEKIKKQLQRNNYYLSFTGRQIYTFTFVSETKVLYFLRDGKTLEIIQINNMLELIKNQEVDDSEIPDLLFDPSDYLISPFNSTAKFLAGEYFLTHQQEDVKAKIITSLEPPRAAKFISISGSAGTGKTLLTYDIARHFTQSKRRPLIIHCGQLNNGHAMLINKGWTIVPIKNYKTHNFADFELIIFDETQRIYEKQFDEVVEGVKLAKCGCIFSYDKIQTLSNWEEKRDIAGRIDSINSITRYKLSEKIRTNKEIAAFIKQLFSNKASLTLGAKNVEINYFDSTEDAKNYLEGLDPKKWEVLRFTPSQYNNEHHEKYFDKWKKTSHQVIGQEFDGVAIAVDKFFSYDENGDLIYKAGAYYAPTKMLFQNITRARKKLNLVIIGNKEILNRCMDILR